MSFKISPQSLNRPAPSGPANGRGNAPKPQADGPASPHSSQVELSHTAQHLATLATAEHDMNALRVNEIRNALANGSLKINPERIADALIASAAELIKTNR